MTKDEEIAELKSHIEWLERKCCEHIVGRGSSVDDICKWLHEIVDMSHTQSLANLRNEVREECAAICADQYGKHRDDYYSTASEHALQRQVGARGCMQAIRATMEDE